MFRNGGAAARRPLTFARAYHTCCSAQLVSRPLIAGNRRMSALVVEHSIRRDETIAPVDGVAVI